MLTEALLLKAAYFGVVCALSAVMVHLGIAVYMDGLRTVLPELTRGERTRPQMARFAWSLNQGFILVYALPFNLVTGILMVHTVLLSADVIGIRARAAWLAALVGLLVGALLSLVISLFYLWLVGLSPKIAPALGLLWLPTLLVLPLIPVLAAFRNYGARAGFAVLGIVALVWLAAWRASAALGPGSWLSAGGLAGLAGTLIVVGKALRESPQEPADLEPYAPNLRRIRGNLPTLVAIGALLAVGASQGWLAGEPLQQVLLANGARGDATVTAFLSAAAYLPMIALSGLLSGVWNQDGYCDWLLGIGYLLPPWLAAPVGAAAMGAEVVGLPRVAQLLHRKPGLGGAAAALREALSTVPEWSLLAGAVMSGQALAGLVGIVVVLGGQTVNEGLGRPMMPIAVPPTTVLLVALASAALPLA